MGGHARPGTDAGLEGGIAGTDLARHRAARAEITAAFLAVAEDPFEATGAAMLALGIAGEIAAETARGPGSFATAYLDALYGLDTLELAAHARIDTSMVGDAS